VRARLLPESAACRLQAAALAVVRMQSPARHGASLP
jgi:hypothetical protein